METLCEYCKKPFVPKRSDALYCSSSCRQLAYVLRKVRTNPDLGTAEHPSIRLNSYGDEKELSTQLNNGSKYPSIQQKQDSLTENGLSVKTDKARTSEEKSPYVFHESAFINELVDLINQRIDNIQYFSVDADMECEWLNVRYRCLVEGLLTLSEMKTIDLDDLKEICNAFIAFSLSEEARNPPEFYPYTNDIKELAISLRRLCIEADEDHPLKLRLKKKTKLKLFATRWELAHVVKRENFNDLNFK